MKEFAVSVTLVTFFFCTGCGIVSNLGTPTRQETKIPAEYNLTEPSGKTMLVLVDQPGSLHAQANLRYRLTKEINELLVGSLRIPGNRIVDYGELSTFRAKQPNFVFLSPAEVGKSLGADIVLFIVLDNYELYEMAGTGYYKGNLSGQVVLLDTASGEKLWPRLEQSKTVRVGFEVESRGQEAGVMRLVRDFAHCTTRYFYNCRKDKFKIADDRSDAAWENWKD